MSKFGGGSSKTKDESKRERHGVERMESEKKCPGGIYACCNNETVSKHVDIFGIQGSHYGIRELVLWNEIRQRRAQWDGIALEMSV